MDKRTNGWMDGSTENLPISLQDFVPYQGRCPATAQQPKNYIKRGKGTADHMMPLGAWFFLLLFLLILLFIHLLLLLVLLNIFILVASFKHLPRGP